MQYSNNDDNKMMKLNHLLIIKLLISVNLFSTSNIAMIKVPLNDSFVDLTDFKFSNNSSESFLEVKFCYSIPVKEEISNKNLYLSLDDVIYINNGESNLFVEETHCEDSKSEGFLRSNAIGDPFPFDMKKGDILYGYIEVITNLTSYRSNTLSSIVPDNIEIPLWAKLARIQLYLFIAILMAGLVILILIFIKRMK